MKCVRCEKEHNGKHKTCEICLEKVRKWNKNNPEKTRAMKWRHRTKKYNMKVEQFADLLLAQGGKCGICKDELPGMHAKNQKNLHLDHNHKTNIVRGFLCGNCNTGLGKFADDPKILLRAVAYVLRGKGSSQRFYEILGELALLHYRKGLDYGSGTDPFANVRGSVAFGVPAWIGAMIRGNDKVKRIQSYIQNGSLANEGLEDSLRDLAVYAVIALVLWEEGKHGNV